MLNEIHEIGGARCPPEPNDPARRQYPCAPAGAVPQANRRTLPSSRSPAAEIHEILEDSKPSIPTIAAPPETNGVAQQGHVSVTNLCLDAKVSGTTNLGGLGGAETHSASAAQDPSGPAGADEGQFPDEAQDHVALVGNCVGWYRRYDDLRRARQRLQLQAMAICRRYCGGDKVAGAKLYANPTAEILGVLLPYFAAMEPFDAPIKEHETHLTELGGQLPVAKWAAEISGLSPRFLAMIVGECGIAPGDYRTVSGLWKRMGLAVIDGRRQRRVIGPDALRQNYNAQRRSLMWLVGTSIMKQQVRSEKDEQGKKIPGTEYAIGEYGQVYVDRRAYLVARGDTERLGTNAKRFMEKRLLRELWIAWRALA